jgi:hypothetical protein
MHYGLNRVSGARNLEIEQLAGWAVANKRGVATDAAAVFALPNSARRAPDAAWTSKDHLKGFSPAGLLSI